MSRSPLRLAWPDLRPRRRWSSIQGPLELVARHPIDQPGLRSGLDSQLITKGRQLRIPREIHPRRVLVARLVIAVLQVVAMLCLAPSLIVSLEFQSFGNRKRRDSHSRQAEMIRAVVVACFGVGVRPDR